MRAAAILACGLLGSWLCREALAGSPPRTIEGVVNINTASPEELRMLSGIGPAKVRNILAYRRAHPFRTVEELVRIKGIGRKMLLRLRMHLAVSGPTTAQIVIRPRAAAETESAAPPAQPPAPSARGRPPVRAAARPRLPVLRRQMPKAPAVPPGFPRAGANQCQVPR